MTDSGFTNIPPAPRNPADIPAHGEKSVTGDLIGVPSDVRVKAQKTQQAVRLQGKVIENRDNGKAGHEVRIQTERGEVDIRIPANQSRQAENLKQGQNVVVNIKIDRNGSPTVTVQPAKPPPKQQAETQPPMERNLPITPEILSQIKLAEIERNAPQTISAPPPTVNGLPGTGSVIRIEPLSAQQVQQSKTSSLQLIASQITQGSLLNTALITLDTAVQQTQNLLQLPPQSNVPALPPTKLVAGTIEIPSGQTPLPETPQILQTTLNPKGPEILSPQALQTPLTADLIAPPFHAPSASDSLKTPVTEDLPLHLTAKVENVMPPLTALNEKPVVSQPNQLTENTRPGQITATVTGFTDRGLPILDLNTPLSALPQSFALQTTDAGQVVQGSRLILSPLPQGAAIQHAMSGIAAQLPTLFASGAWPIMQEVFQTLSQSSPALATALANVTPNPAAGSNAAVQMAPAAMFFIAAIRSGDIANWLGDKAVDVLRREGKGNLLSRLGSEMSALTRAGAEPVSQDWRGLSIPLMWQNEMQKVALYYKHDDNGSEDGESNGNKTRFLFDLDLTRMGKVQLDGLLRGTKLDLIVRTGEAFSQAMQQEMRRMYTGTLEQVQMSGELSFTAKPEKWVTINLQDKQGVSI